MIHVGQFPDRDRILTIRAHVLSQIAPRRPGGATSVRGSAGHAVRRNVLAFTEGWFGTDPPRHRLAADLGDTDALLRHAASLQGLDSDLALLFGRWRHLPYWIDSIWVPGDLMIRPFLFDRVGHGPFFIGSALTLAAELDEIARTSPLVLRHAAEPEGMAEASNGGRISKAWRGYREAARLAQQTGLPIWTEL